MSKVSFENYGKLARDLEDATLAAGRYKIQASAEARILPDVMGKLQIQPDNNLLDIGCNVGTLLLPLSRLARATTGIDHPSCLGKLERNLRGGETISLVSGDFLELDTLDKFDRILCYSVLHYLSDAEEVTRFITKALRLLTPGGRALFGDIPNKSKKDRFSRSTSGVAFEQEWREQMKKEGGSAPHIDLVPDPQLVQFDDELVIRIVGLCRKAGFDTYILPQPSELPFGRTREDILVISPA